MDVESIRIFDDVNDLDVLEVHYLTPDGQERTAIGAFGGYRRLGREWFLRLVQRAAIPMIDIQRIQILTRAGRPQ